MRVLDLAVTPDGKKLIAVTVVDRDPPGSAGGTGDSPSSTSHTPHGFMSMNASEGSARSRGSAQHGNSMQDELGIPMRRRVVIYDLATKEELLYVVIARVLVSYSTD